ncbi:short-chain dehydrogenase [Bartonella krasnovii]|uniref:Short-chain dehydrogenase n=1 Tax=Bartonella krasnovii TaxID=2267275 RepID=A0ABY3VU08_9HYPH|nr:short-chain dehydrogenase [Bartonella krasnovii]UNF28846.1 short-chain dehydrogenase [Bartonella krasnovii]UNF35216.1 short-chain dehydrogenase [Bartonella krasnovii]UNF41922.1 short-chain dehydrogenase [Bartonella krasnovii]UNF43581.1 short-chain dehydrogenase [Bartonella krasnovii]UNF48396.1 short-chain dehydrogenase [Bartonella krasnovii]
MQKKDAHYRYLVVGGTGMLSPFCQSLKPKEAIIAARFFSPKVQLEALQKQQLCIPLDYDCAASRTQFLEAVKQWHGLKYCILWIHSAAFAFSCALIEQLALLPKPPCILHVFGSNVHDQMITEYARKNKVDFISIKLGQKKTSKGSRWLTHQEISQQILDAIKNHLKKQNL